MNKRLYYAENNVFVKPKKPIDVDFRRKANWWKDIKVYYYSQSCYNDLCEWPGTSMTNIGLWWYQYTITDMDNDLCEGLVRV